jgi:hypothetical protein
MLSIVWTVSVGFLGKNFALKGARKLAVFARRLLSEFVRVPLLAFICLHKDWERRVSAVSKEFFGVTRRRFVS